MTPIIAVANHKGGSGKTTTAYHLSAWLAINEGLRVLAVDLDDQGGLTSRMPVERPFLYTVADVLLRDATLEQARLVAGVYDEGCLHLLPADTRLAWAAAKLQAMSPNHMFLARALAKATDYDAIVLDCPPSADIVIVNALMAATHLVIAATPTIESYDGMVRMSAMIDDLGEMTGRCPERLGVVATQVVTNSKAHNAYIYRMGVYNLLGCVPMRVGVDASTQIAAAYAPIVGAVLKGVKASC